MLKSKRFIALIIIIFMISYSVLSMINPTTFAVTQSISTDINGIDNSKYPGIKSMIQSLQSSYPNWNFKILYTGVDWNTVIANEYVGHGASPSNLVPANKSNYAGNWICPICGEKTYDSGDWHCASESAIAYMMDARNSLNTSDVFQFQELTYGGADYNTLATMVSGTFLNNSSYINAIITAAQTYNLNPYYLVARMIQEQGKTGSVLSNGQGYNGEYVGYYNVFNISSSGNGTTTIITKGLQRAQTEGWDSLEKSITGGSEIIARTYISRGQNTLYLQKFDVDISSDGMYWHQYMQNILAAQNEGTTLRKTYNSVGAISNSYTFVIPVYENMPTTASPRPSTTANTVSSDLVRVNVNSNIRLRSEPNGSYTGSLLYKDEIVTRIEKATTKVNGTYWDKVQKPSGITGYVARETYETESEYKLYLVPVETTTTPTPEPTPEEPEETKKVELDETTSIIRTTPEATVQDIIELIGTEITVKDANGNQLSATTLVGTGARVDDKYTVVKLGDVNGDGEITPLDYVKVKNQIMNIKELEEMYRKSADANNDGEITPLDYVKIKNQIMNVSKISI